MLKYIKYHDAALGQTSVWTADKASLPHAEQFFSLIPVVEALSGLNILNMFFSLFTHPFVFYITWLFPLHSQRCDNQLCPHQWILMTVLSSHIVPSGSLWPLLLNFGVCDQIHYSYSIFFSPLCCVLLLRLNLCFLIVTAGLGLGGSICSLKKICPPVHLGWWLVKPMCSFTGLELNNTVVITGLSIQSPLANKHFSRTWVISWHGGLIKCVSNLLWKIKLSLHDTNITHHTTKQVLSSTSYHTSLPQTYLSSWKD